MWWIIVTLILVGILLMLIEMLLIPGVGVAGFLSLASLTVACWYAFTYLGNTAGIITTVISVIFLASMTVIILRAKTWKRFELKTEINSKVNQDVDRIEVGQRGEAYTRLAPMGTGKFGAVSCEVKSFDNSMISAGTPVEVVEISDNKVIVKPINI